MLTLLLLLLLMFCLFYLLVPSQLHWHLIGIHSHLYKLYYIVFYHSNAHTQCLWAPQIHSKYMQYSLGPVHVVIVHLDSVLGDGGPARCSEVIMLTARRFAPEATRCRPRRLGWPAAAAWAWATFGWQPYAACSTIAPIQEFVALQSRFCCAIGRRLSRQFRRQL